MKLLTKKNFIVFVVFLNVMTAACQKGPNIPKDTNLPDTNLPDSTNIADSAKTILFVGNSLTYTNDLPDLVSILAREMGIKVLAEMIAYPNYALEDHWNDGQLQNLLNLKHYDFVIIQQGPSSRQDGRTSLVDYGAKIKALCDNHNTKLAFFMVWPAFANLESIDGVIDNYSNAATVNNSLLCPVGYVWKYYFLETSDYSYYGPDMFHPSLKGSQNAAKIILETLFKKP
ncbi:MAG: hypothetical protein CVU00_11450 [Bacteroidetes bacterium HGW-Bacteroidetes-17]|nr:MAG: hypothetical protein CVU00_11450 [Bacteroidetes bacterium HGW-Bacteroidetes-17]